MSPYPRIGKNLEYGLKQEGLLKFVRELNGNEEEKYEDYLRDASMYARGWWPGFSRNLISYINEFLHISKTVVILSVRGVLVRKFMIAAHSLGMTKGDWTFLDVEIFQVGCWARSFAHRIIIIIIISRVVVRFYFTIIKLDIW
jgi:atrial natriuretic peptide receptor A